MISSQSIGYVITKQWLLASEFSEFEYSRKTCRFWQVRVLATMAFLGNMQDSPDSPTFAKPCCADSPELPTLTRESHEFGASGHCLVITNYGSK